jgi:hypothetical protein
MAKTQRALVQNYVRRMLGPFAGGVGYSPNALDSLAQGDLDQSDVLFVLETSNSTSIEKEDAHETVFTIVGKTSDQERIQVTLSLDHEIGAICVRRVSRR